VNSTALRACDAQLSINVLSDGAPWSEVMCRRWRRKMIVLSRDGTRFVN